MYDYSARSGRCGELSSNEVSLSSSQPHCPGRLRWAQGVNGARSTVDRQDWVRIPVRPLWRLK